jgi:hypothetical protein
MTPEEALRNILKLVEGSDEVEDAHALQILLQSIKTLAEKGLGRSNSRGIHKVRPRSKPGLCYRGYIHPSKECQYLLPLFGAAMVSAPEPALS